MEFPRQPGPVKVTITAEHPEDIYRAFLLIHRILDNNYASTHTSSVADGHTEEQVIDCYPFAVND